MEKARSGLAWRKGVKFYKQPLFWAIIAVLAVVGVIANAVNPRETTEVAAPAPAEQTTTESTAQEQAANESTDIQNSIEMYCEDRVAQLQTTGAVANYIDIANTGNYWSDFNQMPGEYDSEGRPIYLFRWHAKNKVNDQTTVIDCYVSSNAVDDNHMQQLTVDDVTVDGMEYYAIYDENGEQTRDTSGCYSDGSGNC